MLHEYAFRGQADKVRRYLLYKDVSELFNFDPAGYGFLPIHCAVYSGSIETVKILLDAGASLHARTTGRAGDAESWMQTKIFDIEPLADNDKD